jgi:hypothetical protein
MPSGEPNARLKDFPDLLAAEREKRGLSRRESRRACDAASRAY